VVDKHTREVVVVALLLGVVGGSVAVKLEMLFQRGDKPAVRLFDYRGEKVFLIFKEEVERAGSNARVLRREAFV